MKQFLAYFLVVLMLVQSFGRELLVVDYALHQARITELYCVNKARPSLHCDGKCYLAKKLRKAAETEKKAPSGPEKGKLEVLPLAASFRLRRPRHWPVPAPRFAPLLAAAYVPAPLAGVFHPPAFLG